MKKDNKNQLVRSNKIEWNSLTDIGEDDVPGVYIKSLMFDDETNRSPTILLKFEAGAGYPLHNHPAGEEIFVLEGDIKLGKDELFAGDYLFTAMNNKHRVSTQNGCVILLKAAEEVEILKPRK